VVHRPIALPVEFLLCNCEEPRDALTDNREGQLPKTRSKAIVKHILVRYVNDMGLLDRVHRIQAARRLTGKDGQRGRSACAVRQRPEYKPHWRLAPLCCRDRQRDRQDHHCPLTDYHEQMVYGSITNG
jgi:hypothetical protein